MNDTEILNQALQMLETNAETCWSTAERSPEQEFGEIASFIREKRKKQHNNQKKRIRYENLRKGIY